MSEIIILSLCVSSSMFRYHFKCYFFEHFKFILNKKIKIVTVQKRNINKDIRDCLHQLTSDFLIQLILTKGDPFLYVHTDFWRLRIAIRSNWNNYYNITNVPTTSRISQMKQISDSHCFLHLFTNSASQHVSVTAQSLFECKLVCLVFHPLDTWRIYSTIALKLKFDRSIQIKYVTDVEM